jgi:hypothetical protein
LHSRASAFDTTAGRRDAQQRSADGHSGKSCSRPGAISMSEARRGRAHARGPFWTSPSPRSSPSPLCSCAGRSSSLPPP